MGKQKVKVIELVGQKLDPKAKYIFVYDWRFFTREYIQRIEMGLKKLIGNNFLLMGAEDPQTALKVYEILPTHTKPLKQSKRK